MQGSRIEVGSEGKEGSSQGIKVPPPSREVKLPILKHIAELLKRQKSIAIETMGKKGRGIVKELMDERIKKFPWLTRNMMNHYTSTYLEEDTLRMVIDTQQQTAVSGITESSSVHSSSSRTTIPAASKHQPKYQPIHASRPHPKQQPNRASRPRTHPKQQPNLDIHKAPRVEEGAQREPQTSQRWLLKISCEKPWMNAH
jgi:hypothetical protein